MRSSLSSAATGNGQHSPDAAILDRARDRAAAAPMRRELALALARAGQLDEAREVLSGLLTTTPPDAETSGLVGRINKDMALRSSSAEEARNHLETALAFYLDGYRRDGDAYCGINAASLHAMLEDREAARALATELLDGEGTADDFWKAAIRGEASLLLGRVEDAREHYAGCVAICGNERRADLQSAWTQARRLCALLHGDAGLLDESFGNHADQAEPLVDQLQSLRRILEEPAAHNGDSPDGAETPTLRVLAHELLRLQEEQRHTLSRELHDNIAQLLTVTTNRIALVRSGATSKKMRRELAEVKSVAEQALQAVSNLSRNLRPAMIDQMGLAAAIEKHAAAFRDRVKLELHVHIEAPSAETLDGAAATNLFRIVQEALNNIEKHARATEARISLLEEDKLLRLEIADNGRSFSPTHAATAQKNGSLGLVSMRERAEMLGGTFEIEAQHGNGTTVKAAVPMANGKTG
jgi:signal transduction histidine kinase